MTFHLFRKRRGKMIPQLRETRHIPGLNKPYSHIGESGRLWFTVKIPKAVFEYKYRIGAY